MAQRMKILSLCIFTTILFSTCASQGVDLVPLKTVDASKFLPSSNKGASLEYQEIPDLTFTTQFSFLLRQYKSVCDSLQKKPDFADFLQWFGKKTVALPYTLVTVNGKEIKIYIRD